MRDHAWSCVVIRGHAWSCVLMCTQGSSRDHLEDNTIYFRDTMTSAGFKIKPSLHPIVPIMLEDAQLAQDIAGDMLNEGIYVIGFCYPVVPKGAARIRVQISAAHNRQHLDQAINAFVKIGNKYKVIH